MKPLRHGWWRRVRSVLFKETRDHSRDIRSMCLSLIFPLLGPVFFGLMLNATTGGGKIAEVDAEREITVGIHGEDHAPDLIAFLETRKVTFEPTPENEDERRRMVRLGLLPAILEIPPEAVGRATYKVQIVLDQSKPFSAVVAGLLGARIDEFGLSRAAEVVAGAGLDISILRPVSVGQHNVGRSANIASTFYGMIPPLVLFMVFMGAVYLAIDVTAGERERGSLEPLLSAPLDRWELLGGKALSALVFTAGIVAVNLIAFKLILDAVTTGMQGAQPPPTTLNLALIYLLVMPLMVLAVMIQMSIGAVTRSTKEAQIYLGLLPMVPLVPTLVMTFNPPENPLSVAALPIIGQAALMLKLVQNEPVLTGHVAISLAATALAAMLAFLVAVRLFRREKLLF